MRRFNLYVHGFLLVRDVELPSELDGAPLDTLMTSVIVEEGPRRYVVRGDFEEVSGTFPSRD